MAKSQADRLEENVRESLELHIQAHIKSLEKNTPNLAGVAVPALDLTQFKICKVCADDTLRIIASENGRMVERVPSKIEEYMKIKDEHNAKFNKTGQLWSADNPAKRAREGDNEHPPEKPEAPDDVNQKGLILAKYTAENVKIAKSEDGDYEIICGLDENGSPKEVFLHGLRPSVVSDDKPIALASGRYYIDEEVPGAKESDVLPYRVESESFVASFKTTSKADGLQGCT
jgi:hypothetical protein